MSGECIKFSSVLIDSWKEIAELCRQGGLVTIWRVSTRRGCWMGNEDRVKVILNIKLKLQ